MPQEQPKIPLEADVQAERGEEEEPRTGRVRAARSPGDHPIATRPNAEELPGEAFWKLTTVEQLAREQGVTIPQPIDEIIGQGAALWDNDEDFESFVAGMRERRALSRNDERTPR